MELIIIFIVLIAITFLFKNFHSFIYSLGALDIFFRIMHYLKNNINSPELYKFVNANIPQSIPSLIEKYTTGIFNELLMWVYIINFIILEIYIIKTIIDK